jgi:hypothetical protein
MAARDEHVDRRNDQERKERTDGHAAHEHETDRVPGGGARARDQGQGKVAGHGGAAGLKDRAQAGQGRLPHGLTFGYNWDDLNRDPFNFPS